MRYSAKGLDMTSISRRVGKFAYLVSMGLSLCFAPCFGGKANAQGSFAPTAPKPGFGAIYIGRPLGWNTSLFPLPVELNGKPLVSLSPNQYTRVEVRPGRHTVTVPNNFWTRAISGNPHQVAVNVQAGGSYYLQPTRWLTNERPSMAVVNGIAIPTRTADPQSSFSVHAGAPPPAFSGLAFTPSAN
jgi:Protein of unknown function (DUF2846)